MRLSTSLPRLLALIVAAAGLSACGEAPSPPEHLRIAGADPQRGRELISAYGCGACHRIGGIPDARGVVGPPLEDWAQRQMLAGIVPNVPRYLVPWIMDPPALSPETAMPAMGISHPEARDIASYLYTLGARHVSPWPSREAMPMLVEPGVRAARENEDRQRLEGSLPGPRGQPTISIDEAMRIIAGEKPSS